MQLKEKFCGSKLRCCLSTLFCLVFVAAIALAIAYGVRSESDEKHIQGTQGTCAEGTTDASTIKIITLNTFMLYCAVGVQCQESTRREARAKNIGLWFQDRKEDVVLFQEVWTNHDILRDGMAEAGFCHYVMTEKKFGSGLAIFSKHPIEQTAFMDWFDAFGKGDSIAPNPFDPETYIADKGVLYIKLVKDEVPIHIFNLHANSDTTGDNHNIRVLQFKLFRQFVDTKNLPPEELVLMGGDFNEDKDCRLRRCEQKAKCDNQTYYNEMLDILSAEALEINIATTDPFTYNTESNALARSLAEGTDCDYYQYLLDYIFYSTNHLIPNNSSMCEVLNPLVEGKDLSDHFPHTCAIDF